jgi:diguanylate cyclase (GGDEF)-like protein/PAS domain S-box-containing protein
MRQQQEPKGLLERARRAQVASRRVGMLVTVGVIAAGIFTWGVSAHAGDGQGWTAFDDIGQSFTPFLATFACWLTARRSRGRERLAWALIGAGACSWGAGQLLWTLDQVGRGFTPVSPCACDVGFLLSPLLIVAGVLGFVDTPASALSRLRGIFEALLIACGVLVPVWALLLAPVSKGWSGSLAEQVVTLAYPAFDAVGIATVVFVLTRRHTNLCGNLWLLALGIVLLAVADSSFWYLTTVKSYGGVQPSDAGWFVGFLVVGFAALAGRRQAPRLSPGTGGLVEGERLYHRNWLMTAVPEVVVLIGLLPVVANRLIAGSGDFEGALTWMTLGLLGLALAHAVTVVIENHALATHLEDRVAQRTAELSERTAELARREQHFAALVERSSDIVAVIAADMTIVSISQGVKESYGWEPRDLVGKRLEAFGDRFRTLRDVLRSAESDAQGVRQVGWELIDANGRARFADSKITNLLDDPAVGGYVVNTRDVTDQMRLERELRHQAFHDQLSGLANRALFNDRAEHALRRSQRTGARMAVLVIDLDGFKDINDHLGHQAGDGLLRGVAERILGLTRAGDTVARLGGDEFAVLMEDLGDPAEALAAAARLRTTLRQDIAVEQTQRVVTASVGVAISEGAEGSVADLVRDADIAMYVAKNGGKDAERLFEPWMRDQVRDRFELLADLGVALERGEFVLHYQPLYELSSRRLEGFEALLRWRHPTRGLVPPDQFIKLTEENGLIVPLGRWVLEQAVTQLAEWTRAFPVGGELTMAINMSVRQIRDPGLTEDIREAISRAGIAPERIVLEITETMLVHDPAEVALVLQALKDLGVRIAIDDFGTGYASMSYLQQLPIDILKVDRSFVTPTHEEVDDGHKLLGAILNLADTLGLQTVAEGIEHRFHADLLTDAGCDIGQGFLWSPAVNAADATALVDAASTGDAPPALPAPAPSAAPAPAPLLPAPAPGLF